MFTLFLDYENPFKIDKDFVWFNVKSHIQKKISTNSNYIKKLIRKFEPNEIKDLIEILYNSSKIGTVGYDVSSTSYIPFNFDFEINKKEINRQINVNGKEIIVPGFLLNIKGLHHDDPYLLAIMINNKEDFLDSEGYIKLERDDLVMRKLFIKSFYNKIVHPNYDFIVFKLDNDYEKIFTSSKDITIQFTAYLTKCGYNVIPNIKYTEYLM